MLTRKPKLGARIKHKVFGPGVVVKVHAEPTGVAIHFDLHGTRVFQYEFLKTRATLIKGKN